MMRGLALYTAVSWLAFSFHVTVAHPLVDYWHHVFPEHDLSGLTHASCEQEGDHPGSSCAQEGSHGSQATHCHGHHPDVAKTQSKPMLVAPPVYALCGAPLASLTIQAFRLVNHQSLYCEVPPGPLFLSNSSLLI